MGQRASPFLNPITRVPGNQKAGLAKSDRTYLLFKVEERFSLPSRVVKRRVNRSTMGSVLSSFYGGPAGASTGEDDSSSEPSRVMTFDSSESWKIYFKRSKESNKLVSSLFNNC